MRPPPSATLRYIAVHSRLARYGCRLSSGVVLAINTGLLSVRSLEATGTFDDHTTTVYDLLSSLSHYECRTQGGPESWEQVSAGLCIHALFNFDVTADDMTRVSLRSACAHVLAAVRCGLGSAPNTAMVYKPADASDRRFVPQDFRCVYYIYDM
jgi:hypothetical protein